MISAGAKILGNVTRWRDGAKVGAGSLVLESVPAHVTVAGVPAKDSRRAEERPQPALEMNQDLSDSPD